MDLRMAQIQQMQIYRFLNVSLLENAPQLVIQILFGLSNDNAFTDPVTIIAMFFSLLSLLMGCIKAISNVSESRSFQHNKQVDSRLDDWLSTDTMLGEDESGGKKEHIKQNPQLLFKICLSSHALQTHHLYTKVLLTQILYETLGIDQAAIELFAFTMKSKHQLDFFAEISCRKLVKYQLDMSGTKYSRLKQAMLDIGDSSKNAKIVSEIVQHLHLDTVGGSEEIDIQCTYLGEMGKTIQARDGLVAMETHHVEHQKKTDVDIYAAENSEDEKEIPANDSGMIR